MLNEMGACITTVMKANFLLYVRFLYTAVENLLPAPVFSNPVAKFFLDKSGKRRY